MRRCLSREIVVSERLLCEARAELSRVSYARWQADRVAMCDEHLRQLDQAKADYEALKRIYAEARDHHRALRAKLRRDYYALLSATDLEPAPDEGIEAKASTLASAPLAEPFEQIRDDLMRTLDACKDSQHREQEQGNEYCRVHNNLREVVARSKVVADECMALAMKALKMQSTPLGRVRYQLFQRNRR
jgi:hypothetical protein